MKPEQPLIAQPAPRLRRALRFERPHGQPPPLPGVEPRWQEGDPVAGTQYRYVRELGCGVQGLAIEVEHAFLGARAAMKILRAQHVSRRSVAARVRDEARALVELRHPNIVRVTDGGMTAEAEPRPFFVMELLKGDTLRGLLKKGALEVGQALDVGIDILDALDHAHARRMVHRDVKPANIFLARGGPAPRAVLLDFGIVSVVEPGGENRAGFSGTYEYAAPEQLDGYLTAQSDVYALATVLYVCLAGRHPFAGVTQREELARLQRHVVPPPLSQVAGVPAALSDLIAQAMEKDPARRPKSAFALAQKLRDVRTALRGPKPRPPVVVALADATRTTDQLLRDLREGVRELREETTLAAEATTTMSATRVVVRPVTAPQGCTSVLVAPWLPARSVQPAGKTPRPGRPKRMSHHPSPVRVEHPSGPSTVSAPRVLVPAESSSSARVLTLDVSSLDEPSVQTETPPPALRRPPPVVAARWDQRVRGLLAKRSWKRLMPAAPIEVVILFVLFFFVLGGILAMMLAAWATS